jgi:hypothetical protein
LWHNRPSWRSAKGGLGRRRTSKINNSVQRKDTTRKAKSDVEEGFMMAINPIIVGLAEARVENWDKFDTCNSVRSWLTFALLA